MKKKVGASIKVKHIFALFSCLFFVFLLMPLPAHSSPPGDGFNNEQPSPGSQQGSYQGDANYAQGVVSPHVQPPANPSRQSQYVVNPHVQQPSPNSNGQGLQNNPQAQLNWPRIIERRNERRNPTTGARVDYAPREVGWHKTQPFIPLPEQYARNLANVKINRGHAIQGISGTAAGNEKVEITETSGEEGKRQFAMSGAETAQDNTPVAVRFTFNDGHTIGDFPLQMRVLREAVRTANPEAVISANFAQTTAAMMRNDAAQIGDIHISGSKAFSGEIDRLIRFHNQMFPEQPFRNIIAIYETKESHFCVDFSTNVAFIGTKMLSSEYAGLPGYLRDALKVSELFHENKHIETLLSRFSREQLTSNEIAGSEQKWRNEQRWNELAVMTHQIFYLQDLQQKTGKNYNLLVNFLKSQDGNHNPKLEKLIPTLTVRYPDAFLRQIYARLEYNNQTSPLGDNLSEQY